MSSRPAWRVEPPERRLRPSPAFTFEQRGRRAAATATPVIGFAGRLPVLPALQRRPLRRAPVHHRPFRAPSTSGVGRWHAAAVRSGGTDNGAPGVRPEYSGRYYGRVRARSQRQQHGSRVPRACCGRGIGTVSGSRRSPSMTVCGGSTRSTAKPTRSIWVVDACAFRRRGVVVSRLPAVADVRVGRVSHSPGSGREPSDDGTAPSASREQRAGARSACSARCCLRQSGRRCVFSR
jgi:hypothetical protein